jgi:GAF domain-containing protein
MLCPKRAAEAMQKRSRASNKAAKTRPGKARKPKGRGGAKTLPQPGASRARETEVARLTRALSQAVEQQAATADLLKAMSRSAFDLQSVLDTLVRSAAHLTQAEMGSLVRPEGPVFRQLASYGYSRELDAFMQTHPVHRGRGTITGRTLIEGKPVQVADVLADPEFTFVDSVKIGGMRTMLGVPLLRDGEPIGVIVVSRRMVRPFSDTQIELVQSFAAQAVIAIENARLLNELRESLQEQTAASQVLQIISSSPGELQPVFDALLANATRLCAASYGTLWLHENDGRMRIAALHGNLPAGFREQWRVGTLFRPNPAVPTARVFDTRKPVQVADLKKDEAYLARDPLAVASVEIGGIRSLIAIPVLKDETILGALTIYRREVRPFTEKHIQLITNFAAQAAVAIENARLLNELRQRTADLSESLEQQTATSEVLQVISSSAGDLEPVFATVLEKAVRMCDAKFGTLYLREGGKLRLVAARDVPPAFAAAQGAGPFDPAPGGMLDSVIKTRRTVHLPDLSATQAYLERHPIMVQAVELGGVRTVVGVPMLRDAELIGLIGIFRQEVRPFSDKQVSLLTNFAAQAVIAIENARLLNELRQRTEEVQKLNQHLEQRVADQVGEIERMGRLRRFLPPQVADLIVASGAEQQLESHRREITALFCDLRGFTGFTEIADAEDVMALLRDYHAAIGEIIIKYSGTLERYAGDGVMVIFNDPVPVENPALQAVLMALEMRGGIDALTEKWRRLGHDIGFGIGIAHGYATLGTIGFEGRFDYAAIGTVSNVASRLCDEAKPGQILISPRVLVAVKDAVTVEAVGEFELKGIRRPIAAYNVLTAA